MTKNKAQIKKEFDEFAKKIARLEELRQELNALDSKGFESELKLIRVKLKDVNSIPQITRNINELKKKIENRKEARIKAGARRQVSSKLLKEEKALKHDTESMKKKISELERVLSRKKRISTKRQLSKKEVDYINDIPKLERELDSLRNEFDRHGRSTGNRVRELEKLLEKKKKLAVKKQLSKQEVEYVQDIPKLENELDILRKSFEKHTRSAKVKVDAGVGMMVDTKFDDFINEIKAELSERLKEKETAIDTQLQSDLAARESMFAKRYRNLVEEFHDRYRKQVHNELNKEVRSRFEEELNKRLDEERGKIVGVLVKENMKRLHQERKMLMSGLESEYEKKESKLKENIMREAAKLRNNLSQKRTTLKQRLDKINEKERIMAKKGAKLRKEERVLQRALQNEIRKVKKEEANVISHIKIRLKEEINKHKKETDIKFAQKVNAMKTKMHSELITQIQSLKEKNDEVINTELRKRGKQLREELDSEYKAKLRREMEKRKAELDARKAELERHVMEQVRKTLG